MPFNYWKIYEDKITRILVEKNLPHNFNTIKSGYIEKDYNIQKTPESDYTFYDYNDSGRAYTQIVDTLENCKKNVIYQEMPVRDVKHLLDKNGHLIQL